MVKIIICKRKILNISTNFIIIKKVVFHIYSNYFKQLRRLINKCVTYI